MGDTGVDVPAPLVRAFLQQLTADGAPLERRRFLRRVVE